MGRHVLVRVKGLEPPLPYGKQILSLPRLPFRHTRADPRTATLPAPANTASGGGEGARPVGPPDQMQNGAPAQAYAPFSQSKREEGTGRFARPARLTPCRLAAARGVLSAAACAAAYSWVAMPWKVELRLV